MSLVYVYANIQAQWSIQGQQPQFPYFLEATSELAVEYFWL